MRKLVVYTVAYPLYWVGEFLSWCMCGFGLAKVCGVWPLHLLYRPYNWCMVTSYELELWAGTEIIWKKVPPEEGGEVQLLVLPPEELGE